MTAQPTTAAFGCQKGEPAILEQELAANFTCGTARSSHKDLYKMGARFYGAATHPVVGYGKHSEGGKLLHPVQADQGVVAEEQSGQGPGGEAEGGRKLVELCEVPLHGAEPLPFPKPRGLAEHLT